MRTEVGYWSSTIPRTNCFCRSITFPAVDPEASTAKDILDDKSGISGGAAAAAYCFHDEEVDMVRE
jgi:hypothetical protein